MCHTLRGGSNLFFGLIYGYWQSIKTQPEPLLLNRYPQKVARFFSGIIEYMSLIANRYMKEGQSGCCFLTISTIMTLFTIEKGKKESENCFKV